MMLVQVSFVLVFLKVNIVCADYFPEDYDDQRHSFRAVRQRFAYQNPILFAPTLSAAEPKRNHFSVTTVPPPDYDYTDEPKSSTNKPERNWKWNVHSSKIPTTTQIISNDCSGHSIQQGRSCNNQKSLTKSPTYANTVRYAHQNPILVAPTIRPIEKGDRRFPTTLTMKPWEETTTTEMEMELNACKRGSNNHRLDPKTNLCFLLGSVEICGGKQRNMEFYPLQNDSIYGYCDCHRESDRPLVYHPSTDTCYFIFQQAYCSKQDWLTLNSLKGKAECVPNPCHHYGESELKWDWTWNSDMKYMSHEGIVPVYKVQKCVPLGFICTFDSNGEQEFVDPHFADKNSNDKNQLVLIFRRGYLEPTCHNKSSDPVYPPDFSCLPSSKLHISGQCHFVQNITLPEPDPTKQAPLVAPLDGSSQGTIIFRSQSKNIAMHCITFLFVFQFK